MFDQTTKVLIENSPRLNNLNNEELSEELSKFYTDIISFRTQSSNQEISPKLRSEAKRLKKLAQTYEAFIISINNHPLQDSAAFVAATAYSLISTLDTKEESNQFLISDGEISTSVSSSLLFFIAGYFTDAQSVFRNSFFSSEGNGIRQEVLNALNQLINGDFNNLIGNTYNLPNAFDVDLIDRASDSLWKRLLNFIVGLGQLLSGDTNINLNEEIQGIISDCIIDVSPDQNTRHGFYIFRGQYHLASLLKACINPIKKSSISLISPPNGADSIVWGDFLKSVSVRRPFLWRNHAEAINAGILNIGTSSVISFPTGAGKSTLSELKIGSVLAGGKSVIFIAPTNSLINQVIRDLKVAFPNNKIRRNVSNTGEYSLVDLPSDIADNDISVMTPEKCLTQLRNNPEAFRNIGLLIFDEFHIIHNSKGKKSRNIDSMLSLLYFIEACPEADLMLISAMVDNVNDISEWLNSTYEKNTIGVKIEWKPTRQARGCIVYSSAEINALKSKVQKSIVKGKAKINKEELIVTPFANFSLQLQWNTITSKNKYNLTGISSDPVKLALNNNYLTSNKVQVAASIAANFGSRNIKTLLFFQNSDWANSASKVISLCDDLQEAIFTNQELNWVNQATLEIGNDDFLHLPTNQKSACHFGDMLEFERNISESCFSRPDGLMVLSATNTLAQGLNLPAEAVIIVGNDRFDKETNDNAELEAHELLNAAGRAGRAGFSSQGIVLVIPSNLITFTIKQDSYELSPYWNTLQKSVFSKVDSCLEIIDPLSSILDRIFLNPELEYGDILYLLQRLPFDRDGASVKSFIRKSFGSYLELKKGNDIEPALDELLIYQQELEVIETEEIWLQNISYKYGVDTKVLISLNSYLSTINFFEQRSIVEWIRIFFDWLSEENKIAEVIFKRVDLVTIFSAKKNKVNLDEAIGLLQVAIELWISGSTYIHAASTLNLGFDKKCSKIRKVFLKVIPEVSYFLGLLPQLYSGRSLTDNLPLNLAVLSTCVREGFDDPYKLAIHTLYKDYSERSRVQVHQIFDLLSVYLPELDPSDNFRSLVNTIRQAITVHGPFNNPN